MVSMTCSVTSAQLLGEKLTADMTGDRLTWLVRTWVSHSLNLLINIIAVIIYSIQIILGSANKIEEPE